MAWRDAGLLSRIRHRHRRSTNRYMKPEPCKHKVAHTGKLQGNGEDYITGNLISPPRAMALKSLHNERDGLVTKRALGRRIKVRFENPKSRFYALFIYLFTSFNNCLFNGSDTNSDHKASNFMTISGRPIAGTKDRRHWGKPASSQ